MHHHDHATSQSVEFIQPHDNELTEVVMGLHWDPIEEDKNADPADLDAICVLFDDQGCVIDVVHPRHPDTGHGAVVHTGDSRTGASDWDDERIFVFLKALPETVSALSFAVTSPEGRSFGKVRGASCHISDHVTERELIRVKFGSTDRHTTRCVATLHRCPAGWRITAHAHPICNDNLEALLSRVNRGKSRALPRLPAGPHSAGQRL